ncbi:hypothetical protein OAP05_00970 [Schleiferiaceae bacterium]|nr:hypothetical protein [Schleiferiaceae bacterium]
MKLLTTIAAVLISIAAFSQDLIEYDNGTFTQNGEELSMEQIGVLTLLNKAGRWNFRRGNRLIRMHKNNNLRLGNNTLNFVGGAWAGSVGGVVLVGTGMYIGLVERVLFDAIGSGAIGAGLCAVSYKAFSRIASSPEGCLRKRDKEFYKVADKLNEAIKASNQ